MVDTTNLSRSKMKPILAAESTDELERLYAVDAILAFDYDGTLAPIVDDPAKAKMRPQTRRLLACVAQRYSVVIITGRARQDAMSFLSGIPLLDVLGNHGAEAAGITPARDVLKRVCIWEAALGEALQGLEGVVIEDKRLSLSVHYRACAAPDIAAHAIRSAASRLEGARMIGGKQVINVVPAEAPHKGSALTRVHERLGKGVLAFVGDDATDEDAFKACSERGFLGIRVGRCHGTAATHYLDDQQQVDELLRTLAIGAARRGAVRLH